MPHQRPRSLLRLVEKRLRLFPVVGLLGARQTGKSTLLRELLAAQRKLRYVTLDREEIRSQALKHPTLFLQNLESAEFQTVCIDEIQKAPLLFDTLKAEVDEKKRPGRFAISGSTEFSKKTGIMESLTGRISLLRLYPLNLAEISEAVPRYPLVHPEKLWIPAPLNKTASSLKDISNWTERGGMPGMFAVRDEENRHALYESWIETTCTRDLGQFKIPRFDPDLARRVFLQTARLDSPIRTEIAHSLGKDPRQIEPYLDAFKALFVLYEIAPHPQGVGKSFFYPFDAGIAGFAGASSKTKLKIWFLNECYSQFSYAASMRPDLVHYRTARGSEIDFVVFSKSFTYAIKLIEEERFSSYQQRSVDAFRNKFKNVPIFVLGPHLTQLKIKDGVHLIPWNFVV